MLEQRRGEDECLNRGEARWRGELAMRDGEARRGVRTLALIPLSEGRHSRQTSIFVQNSRTGEASECLGEARPEANTEYQWRGGASTDYQHQPHTVPRGA